MNNNNKICRLCLETISSNDFETVETNIAQMFNLLILEIDLDVSEDPVVCIDCLKNLKKLFDFKTSVNQDVKPNIDSLNLNTCIDSKLCRFCWRLIENGLFTLLAETKESIPIVNMLQAHIPELDLSITELITCDTCLSSLQTVYTFVVNCICTEEKIKEYFENEANGLAQIELELVQKYSFKPMLVGSGSVKTNDWCHIEENKDAAVVNQPDGVIKNEEIEIKSVQVTYESSPTNDSFKCTFCHYVTKYKRCIRRHVLIHDKTLERPALKCEICPYKTIHKYYLKLHAVVHKDISECTTFTCNICSHEFKLKSLLRRHMLVHKTSDEMEMRKCPLCPFQTKYKASVNNHMLTHKDVSEVTIYKCDLCPYEGRHKGNLQKHKLNHKDPSEVRMFSCEVCSYKAKYKCRLKEHQMKHKAAPEKPWLGCDYCSFMARYQTNLNKHMAKHKVAEQQ